MFTKTVNIFVSPKWKYTLFSKVKRELKKTRNTTKILKKVLVKGKEKDISSIVPKLIQDPAKIPETILDQNIEIKALKLEKNNLENEFNCTIKFIKEIIS